MVFMYNFFDFSDFARFLYDKTHQNSDFFEGTVLKIARFARLDPEIWVIFLNAV